MGSIFMTIGNIFIVKPSPSSSARATAVAKEAHIGIWERIGEERRGEERIGEERRGDNRK